MAKIKKLLASAIAMASTFATVASMSTAFAYTDEEALINSYADPVAREIIECCLNDGVSLQDAKDLVDGYAESRLNSQNARASSPVRTATGTPYYHAFRKVTNTEYYLVAIVKDSASILSDSFNFSFNTSRVSYDFDYAFCGRYDGISNLYWDINDESSSFVVTVVYSPNTTYVHEAEAFMKYQLSVSGATSVQNIMNNIFFTVDAGNNIDYDIFARGDVDHNGIIDHYDVDDLTDYLIRRRSDLDYAYTDDAYNRKSDYAPVTNWLAADVNKDGSVNMIDAVALNNLV